MMSNKSIEWPSHWLSEKINIVLIGAGGNGSEVFDGLMKIHDALKYLSHEEGLHVTVIDQDSVNLSNCIRQRFWPHEIGQPKATTLVHKANMLFGTNWESIEAEYPLNKGHGLPYIPDLIISCVDNIKTRKIIGESFKDIKTNALWLDLGNTKSTGQIILGHLGQPSNVARINNVIDEYPEILTTEDKPNKHSCSSIESISRQDLFINTLMGNSAMNLLWQLLRQRKINNHGVIIDLETLEHSPIPIN